MSGEIPATKLIALQKVLQSDFMNAVREVYEHVYETVDIQGSQDVRASATAKATVAAFAASEGHAHPRVVELPKTDEGEIEIYVFDECGASETQLGAAFVLNLELHVCI